MMRMGVGIVVLVGGMRGLGICGGLGVCLFLYIEWQGKGGARVQRLEAMWEWEGERVLL